MRKTLFFLVCVSISCGGGNVFKGKGSDNASVIENALLAIQNGQPAEAEAALIATFPPTSQEFLRNAKPSDPSFDLNLTETVKDFTSEQRNNLIFVADAKLANNGIDTIGLMARLVKAEKSLGLMDADQASCDINPDIKNLEDEATTTSDQVDEVSLARSLASVARYEINLQRLPNSSVMERAYLVRGIANEVVIFKIIIAALANLQAVIALGDSNKDYKISPQEAAAIFSGASNPLIRANNFYDLLNICQQNAKDLQDFFLRVGEPATAKALQTVVDRVTNFNAKLQNLVLSNSTDGCSDSTRTDASTITCVEAWLSSVSNYCPS